MINIEIVECRSHRDRIAMTKDEMEKGNKVYRIGEYTLSISKRDIVTNGEYSRGY